MFSVRLWVCRWASVDNVSMLCLSITNWLGLGSLSMSSFLFLEKVRYLKMMGKNHIDHLSLGGCLFVGDFDIYSYLASDHSDRWPMHAQKGGALEGHHGCHGNITQCYIVIRRTCTSLSCRSWQGVCLATLWSSNPYNNCDEGRTS